MTGFQLLYLTGFSGIVMLVAWFSVRVVAQAIRVKGAVGVWRAFRQAGLRPGEVLDAGNLAYCCHRISGLAIFAFLCLHILSVSLLSFSSQLYDEVHVLYASVPMRILECGLLLAILFHAFNGLRLLTLDFIEVTAQTSQRALFFVFWLTLVATAAGSAVILAPIFQ